jgi:hypothetical protein
VGALKNDAAFPRKTGAPETAVAQLFKLLAGLRPASELDQFVFVKTD